MVKIPPFRVFTQPSGAPTNIPMRFDSCDSYPNNLFVDRTTFAYWYWMMCGINIDLGYTIDGGVEVAIRHHYYADARHKLPQKRLMGYWVIDTALEHDDELDITAVTQFHIAQPRCDTIPPTLYESHKSYLEGHPKCPLFWRHDPNFDAMRLGLVFDFEEYADNRDFEISNLKRRIVGDLIGTYTTKFLDQDMTFYLSTNHPEDITGHIDFIRITPEFFEIDADGPP